MSETRKLVAILVAGPDEAGSLELTRSARSRACAGFAATSLSSIMHWPLHVRTSPEQGSVQRPPDPV
jgi:hypothetical protein